MKNQHLNYFQAHYPGPATKYRLCSKLEAGAPGHVLFEKILFSDVRIVRYPLTGNSNVRSGREMKFGARCQSIDCEMREFCVVGSCAVVHCRANRATSAPTAIQ